MSHDRMIEFSFKGPVDPEERATAEDLYSQDLDEFCDWIDDTNPAEREKELRELRRRLPEVLFASTGKPDEFVWLGMNKKLISGWKEKLHRLVDAINEDCLAGRRELDRSLNEILDGLLFFSPGGYDRPMTSTRFLADAVAYEIKPGDHVWIGGIIDYHY